MIALFVLIAVVLVLILVVWLWTRSTPSDSRAVADVVAEVADGSGERSDARFGLYDGGANYRVGDAIQLAPDVKEPEFGIVVLGPPEVVDSTTIRVPVRFTSILPLWAKRDVAGDPVLAFLVTQNGTDEDGPHWISTKVTYGDGSSEELALVKGGSQDGYIYFEPDPDMGPPPTGPINVDDFVTMDLMDASEELLEVHLAHRTSPPERAQFRDGAPLNPEVIEGIGPRLQRAGADVRMDPPVRGLGDPMPIATREDNPLETLTALGPPEIFGDDLMRLRLRITNSYGEPLVVPATSLRLGTAPDSHGRVHHLWDAIGTWQIESMELDLPEAFPDEQLETGATREGYVYFGAGDGGDALPDEPFVTLWGYTNWLDWWPIDLRDSP